ncbi:MAG: hypothetical protein RMY29_014550 [Nostoc sp. CreGUA01]
MAEPTLQQIFGANATQDATTITITKADLPGLTASANNKGESLLAAINLKAQQYLTQANFDANIDQSIIVDKGFSSFVFRGINNDQYRTDQITVSLAKLDTNNTIDPDDY